MRKNIRIAATLASLAVLSSVAAPAVSATAAPTGQKYNTKLISDVSGATQNADNFNSYTSNGFTTYNATEFKKVLEIEDDGNIPAVTFTYNITLPTENKPAVYDGGTLKSLAVYKGINPQNINYKLITVNDNSFNTDGSTDTVGITKISPATAGDPTGFELTYKAQKVTGGDANTVDAFVPDASTADGTSPKKAPIDDNVLINNVKQDKTNTDSNVDTYYAIKTVQMDFSGCEFTEPGIYRYYITETGSNVAGMKCGQTSDLTKAAETVRTVDVYVEDATFMDGSVENNYLRIAGYVMYVGEQTAGPDYKDPDTNPSATDPSWQVNLEDGLTNTSSTTDYGKVNGAEIMNGTNPVQKSEGIPNFYRTNDLTFGKTVTGNQGSKDKYFKFTLALTADSATTKNVAADDTFAITGVWDSTVTANTYVDGATTGAPNAATPYAATVISNASNTIDSTSGQVSLATESSYGNNVKILTGAQLIAGYSFYLSDADHITVHGLPEGIGYTITEYQDDYTPTYDAWNGTTNATAHPNRTAGSTDYDGVNANAAALGWVITSETSGNTADTNADGPQNIAVLTDTKVEKDVDVQFTNTRKGTIPTGVILSVAAPATIGIAVVGGIIYLVAKRKKDEDDEEE